MRNTAGLLKGGKKGNKGGSGRPSDWLREKCEGIIEKKKLIEWLGNVASGESVDTRIVFDEDNVPHHEKLPAAIKDRLRAMEMLSDRAWGKAAQMLSNDPDHPFENSIFVLPSKDSGSKGGIS